LKGKKVMSDVEYEYVKYGIELVKESTESSKYEATIESSDAMADFLINVCKLNKKDRENFIAAAISSKGEIIGFTTVSIGDLSTAMVHPRELMKFAILTNAAAIIIAHNHPSNITRPSLDDINTTKRIGDACNLMGIKLLDHIIVGTDGCNFHSMRALGYIKEKEAEADSVARQVLADLTGMSANDSTNALITRFIFGKEQTNEKNI
jgi:DNA repair protein RadC